MNLENALKQLFGIKLSKKELEKAREGKTEETDFFYFRYETSYGMDGENPVVTRKRWLLSRNQDHADLEYGFNLNQIVLDKYTPDGLLMESFWETIGNDGMVDKQEHYVYSPAGVFSRKNTI